MRGKVSDQVVAARHIRFQTSKILYFRKHHGWWQASLLRAFLLSTYLYQLAEENGQVRHRPQARPAAPENRGL